MLSRWGEFGSASETLLRGTEGNAKFIAPAKSVVEQGLLSPEALKQSGDITDDNNRRSTWQGESYISVFDDNEGSFVESEYSTPIITYIIDQRIKSHCKVLAAEHGFAMNNEYIVEGSVFPEDIVAAYMPHFSPEGRQGTNDISWDFMTFYNELILRMIDNPEHAFPIISGTHHYRPLYGRYYNTEEVAKILTNPERVYFGR
jgi:hypothetical protein